jgi:uncharacterized protein
MKQDLTDAELDELDALLEQTPAPCEPLNVLMLDGYLAGVLVQPRVLTVQEWSPPIFDMQGQGLPPAHDAAWLAHARHLIERRRDALNAAISEDGWFDPLVVDVEREPPQSEYEGPAMPDTSRALLPWVAGFHWAQECFAGAPGGLDEVDDDAAELLLARLYRHLPPSPGSEGDEDRAFVAELDRERPLKTVDEGIVDLVTAVVELWDLTAKRRFAVKTITREHPKPGRNDPCFCGSGKKYKACHGKT